MQKHLSIIGSVIAGLSILGAASWMASYRERRSSLPFVYSSRVENDPSMPDFAEISEVRLEEIDLHHYKLSVRMISPIKMKQGDRLCIETLWTCDQKPYLPNGSASVLIVVPVGYSYQSTPPLASGNAGAVTIGSVKLNNQGDIEDTGYNLISKSHCQFDGEILSTVFHKRYFGGSSRNWPVRFKEATSTFCPGQIKQTMANGRNVKSQLLINDNYLAAKNYTYRQQPSRGYAAEKPTILPKAVRIN